MKRRTALVLGTLILGTVSAWAYEPSLLNMTVPSALQQGDIDLLIQHRFYGSVLDNPLTTLFGLEIGANVALGARYMILPGLVARVLYTTGGQEITVGAGYAYHLQNFPLAVQAEADFISPQGFTARGYGVFGLVTAEAGPFFNFGYLTVEAGYDSYLNHFGAGIGGRIELNESWAIVGEFYPFIAEGIEQHVEELGSSSAFSAGLMLTTAGHQFSLVIGNSSAVGERRLMAGTPGFTGLYLGFNIQRRLP